MNQFEFDTAVNLVEEGVWLGEVRQGWRIGEAANGGYVLAIGGRALREALPHRDPLGITAIYLAPITAGPIECRVEVLRSSRKNTHATVKMSQQGELKVQATGIYTDMDGLQGEDWIVEPRPIFAPVDECENAANHKLEYRQKVDVWLDSASNSYPSAPDGSGELRGWIAHGDGAAPDLISLLMFADGFPPPVFALKGPVAWVPTLELSVQIRARPAPGPVQSRLRSRYLTRGLVEADAEFWDSEGVLVAISRQLMKVRY
ncbi:MAG: thioesterase family protein [Halieaceae bacterium]